MSIEGAYAIAEKLEKTIGHLHNISAHVDLKVVRRLYLDAQRAFQTARCERRRRKNFSQKLEIFVLSVKGLCSLAEKGAVNQSIPLSVRQSISAMEKELKSLE